MKRTTKRPGFTLLEIVPVLTVATLLLLITILAINPGKQFRDARNKVRFNDIAFIADVITQYTHDNGRGLLLQIPMSPSSPVEVCADVATGSCTGLLDLTPAVGLYIHEVPIDPEKSDDADNEHSRYFVIRERNSRITVSAPDTEPLGSEDVSVTR